MKTVIPDFYEKFNCKAGDCKHSCCKGWEIDVDSDSFFYYQSLDNPFGKKICDAIYTDKDGAHFQLTKEKKCPFLREDNLCEMILTIGEESLCDICALHPRFYEDYKDYVLCGVGLSCEKVCELLWDTPKKLRYLVLDDKDEMTQTEDFTKTEFSFFIQKKSYIPNTNAAYVENLLSLFQKTEPIDKAWVQEISAMIADRSRIIKKAVEYKKAFDSSRFQRLFSYIAYRQLEAMPDETMLYNYATRCTDFIFLWDAYTLGTDKFDTKEHIRRFSEQIEYSTENVDIIC